MRRYLPLLLLLCLVSLPGCSTSIVKPITNPSDPIPEPEEPVYNGEPTQLVVELQRNEVELLALSRSAVMTRSDSQDAVYVHITKENANGDIVFQTFYTGPLPSGEWEIELPFEVPADQGYEINTHTCHGDGLLGVAPLMEVSAPAKTLTTATIPLETPWYELTKPGEMFSGGSLSQIALDAFPKQSGVGAVIFLRFEPWTTNPHFWQPGPGFYRIQSSSSSSLYLPEVEVPTKLYYQVAVGKAARYGLGQHDWHYCFQYFPDLTTETELPYIMVYPYPGWTE
jgi:hypothetical protein